MLSPSLAFQPDSTALCAAAVTGVRGAVAVGVAASAGTAENAPRTRLRTRVLMAGNQEGCSKEQALGRGLHRSDALQENGCARRKHDGKAEKKLTCTGRAAELTLTNEERAASRLGCGAFPVPGATRT